MPDNKLPKLTKSEFEEALLTYLEYLEKNMGKMGGFPGWVQNVLPGTSPREYTNQLYDYYMGIAESQGVGDWIPGYENILAVGAPNRLQWEQVQQYLSDFQETAENEFNTWLAKEKLNLDKAGEQRLLEQFEWQKQQFGELSPIQKQQLQQQSWERLNQADIARWEAQGEASRFETERMINSTRDIQAERDEIQRQKNEMSWENIRNDILASVQGSPRSWIQASKAANLKNPYTQDPESFQQNYEAMQEDYKRINQAAKRIESRLKDPNDTLTQKSIDNPQTTEQQIAWNILVAREQLEKKVEQADVAWMRAKGYTDYKPEVNVESSTQAEASEEAYWATPRGDENVGYTVGRPSTPVETRTKVPDWLQVAAGVGKFVPEKRQDILTPSGASWTALNPTQRAMYAGLVDVAGNKSFEDIEWERDVMLPKKPSLGKSWKPASQRI